MNDEPRGWWQRPWLWVGGWAALILTGTSMPALAVPGAPTNTDKGAHFLLYLPLGAFLVRALSTCRRWPRWQAWALAVVAGGVFGAFDEWHQQFIPTRSCDFWDWLADLTGICTGCIIVVLLWRGPVREREQNGRTEGPE